MKITKFLFLPLVLVFLGFGCEQEYDTRESGQTPLEALSAINTAIKPSSILDPNQTTYSAADRLAWYQTLNWPQTCEQEYRDFFSGEDSGLRFYEIGTNIYVLSITCNTYAYQANLLFMIVTFNPQTKTATGIVQKLQSYNPISKELETIEDEETGAPVVLGFDFFDPKNKTLSIYTKHRGLGDCGTNGTYTIINNKITLIKYEAQSCENADEFYLKNPTAESIPAWPVIYEKK